MTYRERRERRAEQLNEWADKREAKQPALNEAARADEAATGIPFGQPILVGHHSERRHRNAIAKIDRAMAASVENSQTAATQRSRAAEIEAQAERAIYDDDPDAIERLTAKLETLEAERERRKKANADYRKANREALRDMTAYERHQAVPYPSYSLSNLGGVISNTRKRIQTLSRPEHPRLMTSRRAGECRNCTHGIEAGQQIMWFRRAGEAEHVECPTNVEGESSE